MLTLNKPHDPLKLVLIGVHILCYIMYVFYSKTFCEVLNIADQENM